MRASFILRAASEPPAMASVRQMLKAAMRSGNSVEKNTIKAVMAAVKNANIAKSESVTTDLAFSGVLNSLIKKRLQSAEEYVKGQREDLAANEKEEASILNKILAELDIATPAQLDESVKSFLLENSIEASSKDAFKAAMAKLPKNVETIWRSPKSSVVSAIRAQLTQKRSYSTMSHENPIGLRRRTRVNGGAPTGKRRIEGVNNVILVSSAKGGVGKSTVSTNLALALSARGKNVGLLDADIFGPSIPKMLGLEGHSEPRLSRDGSRLLPVLNHGIKAMSMGFLIPTGKSVSWRGLLVQKALQQLLFEVEWGPTDYLVIDLPPGTGDVQLTIGQQLDVDAAILVTTPQDVALIDVERGLDMFKQLKTPVLGLVENMSHFVCPCCGTETKIFGDNSSRVRDLHVAVVGRIPLLPAIAAAADAGEPAPPQDYLGLADAVIKGTA